jgi:F-type H+-transporting ATPase subunit alpha
MVELLKQGQYKPFHVADQVISIFAGTKGLLDDVPIARIRQFEQKLLAHVQSEFREVRAEIVTTGELSDAVAGKLKEIIGNFKKSFLAAAKR